MRPRTAGCQEKWYSAPLLDSRYASRRPVRGRGAVYCLPCCAGLPYAAVLCCAVVDLNSSWTGLQGGPDNSPMLGQVRGQVWQATVACST